MLALRSFGDIKPVANLPHPEEKGKSRDIVAEKLGISGSTFSKAKKGKRKGND